MQNNTSTSLLNGLRNSNQLGSNDQNTKCFQYNNLPCVKPSVIIFKFYNTINSDLPHFIVEIKIKPIDCKTR